MARKSPAFSFYPDSWFSGTAILTREEKGLYIDMLSQSWLHVCLTREQFMRCCFVSVGGSEEKMLDRILTTKFTKTELGFINERLEEEREKQRARAKAGSKGGSKTQAKLKQKEQQSGKQSPSKSSSKGGSKTQGSVSDSVSVSISDLTSVSGSVSIGFCSEADKQPTEPSFDPSSCKFPIFPCAGDVKTWKATDGQLKDLAEAYPGIDVANEHRRSHLWIMANLKKRKTANRYLSYLTSWCARAQNSSGGSSQKPQQKTFAQISEENTKRAILEFKDTINAIAQQ